METILVKKRKNAKKGGYQKIQVNAQTIPLEKARKNFCRHYKNLIHSPILNGNNCT